MPWGAAIGAIGAIGGALISSNGAKSAANAQAHAADEANQTQLQMYNQTRADNMPALGARNDALARLESLLGVGSNKGAPGFGSLAGPLNVGDVTNDPGYKFGLNQGMRQLQQQETARGMNASGAALTAAARYGNDYATTKYDDAFNRAQTNRQMQLNPLQSLAGLGQTGATTMAQAGANAANQIGANQVGAGNAMAANSLAQANIWANAGNQLAGWYQNSHGAQNNLNSGNGYYSNGSWYANNDLSGTNLGSGD